MSPTKGSWRIPIREPLGGKMPRSSLSSSNPLSNLYHRRPWMSLLPSYHGSGIYIFLRARKCRIQIGRLVKQDLWEKLKVPEKEFVEAYKNMITITQSLNIILQSASIAKRGSIRSIITYPSSF
jgi:hypothetical protein